MIGYALYNKKKDGLHSLYVDSSDTVPIGKWLEAKEDAEHIVKPNGRKYVKSKLGWLAWRPGKHVALFPLFSHIGKRQDGQLVRRKDSVICEIEVYDEVDWNTRAHEHGTASGKVVQYDCCLDHLPYDGFYYYQTNSRAEVDWIICHKYRINRILSEAEVNEICRKNGLIPQPMAS